MAEPAHKNLYVLNVPLDVSTVQLENLFSAYGTVRHCVILSMLDGQARRRGFVDMDTAEEAQRAVRGVHGRRWLGYPLEVTYARVQRSGTTGAPDIVLRPCQHLVLHGLLPWATVDEGDVRSLVVPHAAVASVDFSASSEQDTLSAEVKLVHAREADSVVRALHGQRIRGQHLEVEHGEQD